MAKIYIGYRFDDLATASSFCDAHIEYDTRVDERFNRVSARFKRYQANEARRFIQDCVTYEELCRTLNDHARMRKAQKAQNKVKLYSPDDPNGNGVNDDVQ